MLSIDVTSFYSKEVKLLNTVTLPLIVNINKLPDDTVLFNLLLKDKTLSEEKRNRIVKAYRKKIEYLSLFQTNPNEFKRICYKAR